MAKTEEYFAAYFLLHHFLLRIILFPTTFSTNKNSKIQDMV